jgi:hypothetical protein
MNRARNALLPSAGAWAAAGAVLLAGCSSSGGPSLGASGADVVASDASAIAHTGFSGYIESFQSWGYAKDAFDKWAAVFARRFDELRGIKPQS